MVKKFTKVKDSGRRQEFNTGSKRDTNEGKPRYDLLSVIGLHRVAMHTANGATKYGARNWEKGQPLSRYIESAHRHLSRLEVGLEDEDHGSALVWNIMAFMHTKTLIETGDLPKELDDMPVYSDKVKQIILNEGV